MKARSFEVPVDVMGQFAEIMEENEFNNSIKGVMENGDILVKVEYDSEQRDVLNDIHELIDEYNDEREDEDDD